MIIFAIASPTSAGDLPSPDNAPPFTAAQVIAEINAYRQANGVGAMQYNGTLASLAQNHSAYMASTGLITHDEGASSPTDRAYAAGYGGGKKIILSEIIYGGTGATVSDAITWWKNSEIHNRVMLDGRYAEIGAGVSSSGGMTYFTAEIAFITGSSAPSPSDNSSDSQEIPADEDTPPVFAYSPVIVAAQGADGSVIHIVQSGQTLWTIAAVYQVELQTILDLNNLSSGSWVYPGDEILVKPPGSSPQATPEIAATKTTNSEGQTALGTAFSSQPIETATQDSPSSSPTPLPTIAVPGEPFIADPTARWMILIAFVIIFVVVVGSIFLQKPAKRPPPDDLFSGPI
ncbi:MAG: CAP domain-containing protein [Chloroflexota bacterium]